MEDVNISIYRASVVREGSTPASPGFVVSDGQNPVDPSGSGQNHLPVTITPEATGLSITESQVLGGAGTVGQYIRGDGSLADFPATTGGGSSVSYYLNGSVSQGTIGGVAYKELNRTPVFGTGTDISINADGYIASFITDALDPNKLLIPGGNWNFETYFSASSSGGSPSFYVELYKYDGTTFTLIASSSSSPELIAFGTNLNPYFSTLAVPETVLALTDRLAVRYYVTHSGRTITLHTENGHLCEVITTFTTGLTALNGLTNQVQFFAVGTSGTDFAISSVTDTHTFNLPTASATNRGALSSADWTTFNNKENAITAGTTAQYFRGDKTFQTLNTSVVPELTNLYYTEARVNANTNVAANTAARHNAVTLGTANGLSLSTQVLSLGLASAGVTGALSGTDWSTFNSKQNALTNPVTGTGTTNYLAKFTGTSTIGNSLVFDNGTNVGIGTGSTGGSRLNILNIASNPVLSIRSQNNVYEILTMTFDESTDLFSITNKQAYSLSGIAFGTNNTERVRITQPGNLLVGTTTDAGFKLDVNGTGRFSSHLRTDGVVQWNGTVGALSYGSGFVTMETNSATQIRLVTNGTTALTLATNQAATFSSSVGVNGVTSPAAELQVGKSSDVTIAMSNSSSVTSGNRGSIAWYNSNVSTVANIRAVAVTDNVGTELQFYTRPVAGSLTQVLTIASTGKIGINNNIGYNQLDLKGTNTNGSVLEGLAGFYRNTAIGGALLIRASDTSADIAATWYSGATNMDLTFTTVPSSGTYFERMRITSGGNVLIGTTTDISVKLYVKGSAATNLFLESTGASVYQQFSNSGGNAYIGSTSNDLVFLTTGAGNERMKITSGGDVYLNNGAALFYGPTSVTYVTGSTTNMSFAVNTGERMRITSGGNVLIGTTTDNGFKLRVEGSNYLNGSIYSPFTYNNTSSGSANLGISASGEFYRSTSSLKYKKNVQDYNKGLSEVLQMRPVTYNDKNDNLNATLYAGLIAEEINNLGLVEFVQYAQDGTPDALSYSNMVAILVKSIQELKQEIDTLKN